MEIQVGEYVRTKNGIIAKLEFITEFNDYFFDRTMYQKYSDTIEFLQEYELDKYIIKHSFNIIDLIEEGDYVNGERIDYITTSNLRNGELILMTDGGYDLFKKYQSIKSIVTKEQFESIKYEV